MNQASEAALRVMVVDDQEGVRMVVADTVKFAGHQVVAVAADGEEAVALARQHRPDVIIMDVQMPKLNGPAAMDIILQERTAKHVILMSGEWRSAGLTTAELMRRGATAFLEKPFSVTRLFELLDESTRALRKG
jgi:CheY-like chemotaxis protein